MAENKKKLVLDVMDGKKADRVPSGFWFHFLDDEIHADAFKNPELTDKLLQGEEKYIEQFAPDFVKIMTDGFFPYPYEELKHVRKAADLLAVQPLPDDSPWFTKQLAYAKKLTSKYGDNTAMFYNLFGAATTFKFMQPTIPEGEALLTRLLLEDKAAVKHLFDVISGDVAKLAARLIREGGVTGIYFSVQSPESEDVTRELYEEVFKPGELQVLAAANHESTYNILHICGYAGHHNKLEWYQDYPAKVFNWAVVIEGVPLAEGRKLFPGKALLGGFANSEDSVLYRGSKAEIQQAARELIRNAGEHGILLGADCTVPRDIDWQRLEWVREAAVKVRENVA
jgi:uroporphyrinogen decarboxylase